MASSDGPSPSPRLRSLRRLFHFKRSSSLAADHKPRTSSFTQPPPAATSAVGKKKAFGSSALCGLGCAFSNDSIIRSSANSQGTGTERRRTKKIKEARGRLSSSISSLAGDKSVGSLSHDGGRALRERPYPGRRGGSLEHRYSVEDSFPSSQATLLGSDPIPFWGYPRLVVLEEIISFHNRVRSQIGDVHDRYSDWQLDVDNMTYEDLLELGDNIGYVSTGLREEEIACSIIEVKPSNFDMHISTEMEGKCSICQEEYEMDDEVGKLGCGHSFHIECIKKWLLQKNACPVCKAAVSKT